MTRQRSRPGGRSQAARNAKAGVTASIRDTATGPAVRALLRVDLTPHEVASELVDALKVVVGAPDGASVVLVVAPGQLPWRDALVFLAYAGQHLSSIAVESSSVATIHAWTLALTHWLGKAGSQ